MYAKRKTNVLTLFALTIIVLGIAGFSYAHWQDTLTITGTVETGTLCAEFQSPIAIYGGGTDWTCGPGFVNPDPHMTDPPKDVGSTTAILVNDKTIQVTLDDVYPCYWDDIHFDVVNCGSIPWIILNVTFNPGNIVITEPSHVSLDLTGDTAPDIEIKWKDNFGVQNDPGDIEFEISFEIHVLNDIPRDTSGLTFTAEIAIWNWNEV